MSNLTPIFYNANEAPPPDERYADRPPNRLEPSPNLPEPQRSDIDPNEHPTALQPDHDVEFLDLDISMDSQDPDFNSDEADRLDEQELDDSYYELDQNFEDSHPMSPSTDVNEETRGDIPSLNAQSRDYDTQPDRDINYVDETPDQVNNNHPDQDTLEQHPKTKKTQKNYTEKELQKNAENQKNQKNQQNSIKKNIKAQKTTQKKSDNNQLSQTNLPAQTLSYSEAAESHKVEKTIAAYLNGRYWLTNLIRGKSLTQLSYSGKKLFYDYIQDTLRQVPVDIHHHEDKRDIMDLIVTDHFFESKPNYKNRLSVYRFYEKNETNPELNIRKFYYEYRKDHNAFPLIPPQNMIEFYQSLQNCTLPMRQIFTKRMEDLNLLKQQNKQDLEHFESRLKFTKAEKQGVIDNFVEHADEPNSKNERLQKLDQEIESYQKSFQKAHQDFTKHTVLLYNFYRRPGAFEFDPEIQMHFAYISPVGGWYRPEDRPYLDIDRPDIQKNLQNWAQEEFSQTFHSEDIGNFNFSKHQDDSTYSLFEIRVTHLNDLLIPDTDQFNDYELTKTVERHFANLINLAYPPHYTFETPTLPSPLFITNGSFAPPTPEGKSLNEQDIYIRGTCITYTDDLPLRDIFYGENEKDTPSNYSSNLRSKLLIRSQLEHCAYCQTQDHSRFNCPKQVCKICESTLHQGPTCPNNKKNTPKNQKSTDKIAPNHHAHGPEPNQSKVDSQNPSTSTKLVSIHDGTAFPPLKPKQPSLNKNSQRTYAFAPHSNKKRHNTTPLSHRTSLPNAKPSLAKNPFENLTIEEDESFEHSDPEINNSIVLIDSAMVTEEETGESVALSTIHQPSIDNSPMEEDDDQFLDEIYTSQAAQRSVANTNSIQKLITSSQKQLKHHRGRLAGLQQTSINKSSHSTIPPTKILGRNPSFNIHKTNPRPTGTSVKSKSLTSPRKSLTTVTPSTPPRRLERGKSYSTSEPASFTETDQGVLTIRSPHPQEYPVVPSPYGDPYLQTPGNHDTLATPTTASLSHNLVTSLANKGQMVPSEHEPDIGTPNLNNSLVPTSAPNTQNLPTDTLTSPATDGHMVTNGTAPDSIMELHYVSPAPESDTATINI